MKADVLVTKENSYPVDGVFYFKKSVSPKNLVPGLQMDGNHVAVNLQMETNVPDALPVCDIADGLISISSPRDRGNIAALSAVSYLDRSAGRPAYDFAVQIQIPKVHNFIESSSIDKFAKIPLCPLNKIYLAESYSIQEFRKKAA